MSKRKLMLPFAALVLVVAVVAINIAAGGADYNADKPADPCMPRETAAVAPKIDAVAQQVVLAGLDETACSLGISRERLLLALASPSDQDELIAELETSKAELAQELKAGMKKGITKLGKSGELPKVSALLPDIVDELNLGPAGDLANLIPESVIDDVVPTEGVLQLAADRLDYEQLLTQLSDPDQLEPVLRKAIQDAAIEEARARITEQLGESGLGGIFN
jgi:hypothetical protein